MVARFPMALACASLLALAAASAVAQSPSDAAACKGHGLSGEALERCAGLTRHDRYKARVLARLERVNQPPQAALELIPPTSGLPAPAGRISLDASGSIDEDGFVEHYTFQLFDAETGDVLSSGVRTRDPFATLTVLGGLPPQVRANVIVEDDLRATDTTDMVFASEAADTCSNVQIQCTVFSSGQMDCDPIGGSFSTDEVLDAAQQCDASLTKDSPLLILAVGANGGRGANIWGQGNGGSGGDSGVAAMTTTLTLLDQTYGDPSTTSYCYGVGQDGAHGDTHSGAGGASTILRTCQNVSQTDTTGVLLIAAGGGGGEAAGDGGGGSPGGTGGEALSTTAGSCPPSCASGSTASGAGSKGGGGGGDGGDSGRGGASPVSPKGNGYDGIGGHGGDTTDTPIPMWHPGNPLVVGNPGAGGSQQEVGGGSGGGGYGGGAAGNVGGGGGGGGHAAPSFREFTLGRTTGARLEFVFNWSGFSD